MQAAVSTTQCDTTEAGLKYPKHWGETEPILKKLAYTPNATDSWLKLGMSAYEGPTPTEQAIQARLRSAQLLCSLGESASWSTADKEQARIASEQFQLAAAQCADALPNVIQERKRLSVFSTSSLERTWLTSHRVLEEHGLGTGYHHYSMGFHLT